MPGQHVLGGEEPVVAAQVHPATDRDRLANERGPELARGGCRHGVGEEDPHVRADPGAGHLQRRWRAHGSCGLQVGERVEHRGLSVEVGGEPAGLVAGKHRIEADVDVAGQMRGEDLGRQRQVPYVRGMAALAPAALDGGHPPRLARAGVLPAHGVDVTSCAEQRGVELDLGPRGGTRVHLTRCLVEPCRLGATSGSRLRIGQLEELAQASILLSQALQFGMQVVHGVNPAGRPTETAAENICVAVDQCSSVSRGRRISRNSPEQVDDTRFRVHQGGLPRASLAVSS